jgi:prepilin-type N-terminal cleavage/methylation domain-containing protein
MSRPFRTGFTIVELLIVTVVIAILAVIAIVAFNGVQQRAIVASVESDVRNSVGIIESTMHLSGQGYPSSFNSASLAQSGTNVAAYVMKSNGYCVSVTGRNDVTRIATQKDTRVREGTCVTVLGGTVSTYLTTGSAITQMVGIAKNPTGGFYIADGAGSKIWSVNSSGVVSLLAGSYGGSSDGTGASAQFYYPSGIDVDAAGNVFVADGQNHRIRKVTPAGVVTTIAGGNTSGYADGVGASALFNFPASLAVAADGAIYVADYGNNRIRKVLQNGTVTTYSGNGNGMVDGAASVAKFSQPRGIALATDGTMYITDSYNGRIRKIATDGAVSTVAGAGFGTADGTGAAARFNNPNAIKLGEGNILYVTDSGSHRIRKVTLEGVVTTLTGTTQGYTDGSNAIAQFYNPSAFVLDDAGTMYVTDTNNNKIRKVE